MNNFYDKYSDKLNESFYNSVAEIENLNKELAFNKVPNGIYRVEVKDMSVKQSKRGNWMIMTIFKVLEGQYEGSLMSAFFMINKRWTEMNNGFLKALDTKIPIECRNILQYQQLVDDVFITIRGEKQYDLEVENTTTGFSNYRIIKSYDVEYEPLPFIDD